MAGKYRMNLTVLGCDGGRALGYQNTSLLLNEHVLIDAGTIQSVLTIEDALKITDIFLTHAHLDHIIDLPFLLDATFEKRTQPLRIHGLPETLDVLMTHIFNDVIWPNFSALPCQDTGQFTLHPMGVGDAVTVDGLKLTALQANHTIPTVGYMIEGDSCEGNEFSKLVFSGDSGPCDAVISAAQDADAVILDLSFPVSEQHIADISGHMTAKDVAAEMEKIPKHCAVYVFHAKVGQADVLLRELSKATSRQFTMLRDVKTISL